MTEVAPKQQILTLRIQEEHEYDPEEALRLFKLLNDNGFFSRALAVGIGAYGEYEGMDDEQRIINLFELLNESLLGDAIFGQINWDHGSQLSERGFDE